MRYMNYHMHLPDFSCLPSHAALLLVMYRNRVLSFTSHPYPLSHAKVELLHPFHLSLRWEQLVQNHHVLENLVNANDLDAINLALTSGEQNECNGLTREGDGLVFELQQLEKELGPHWMSVIVVDVDLRCPGGVGGEGGSNFRAESCQSLAELGVDILAGADC